MLVSATAGGLDSLEELDKGEGNWVAVIRSRVLPLPGLLATAVCQLIGQLLVGEPTDIEGVVLMSSDVGQSVTILLPSASFCSGLFCTVTKKTSPLKEILGGCSCIHPFLPVPEILTIMFC